jgi:hypothetical protein
MASRFRTLKNLAEDSATTLRRVKDAQREGTFLLRRFKNTDAAHIAGLESLFRELAALPPSSVEPVIEHGTDKDGFFVLSPDPEPGVTLSELLQRGPLNEREFETLALQSLAALEQLQDHGIVHGALTPELVRISGASVAEWQVSLHGFGRGFAAKSAEEEDQVAAYRCAAPEQWQGQAARRRTDVYALGCILHEALTARPAFAARTLKALRAKHLGHDLPPLEPQAPQVPRWMCAWVMSLLIADPEARPRKAAVARETFSQRDAAASVSAAAPVLAPRPLSEPAPIQAVQAAVVSAPVMLPAQRPAQNATASTIPIAVGPHVATQAPRRPVPVPTRAVPSEKNAPKPARSLKPVVIIAAAVVILVLAGMMLMKKGGTASSGGSAGAAAPKLIDISTPGGALKHFREIGAFRQRYHSPLDEPGTPAWPAALKKPFAHEQLFAFYRAGAGMNTFSGSDDDKPGRVTDTLAFWHDLGTLRGNNALAVIPWNPAPARRVTLQLVQPDAKQLPLAGPRYFAVFGAAPEAPDASLGSVSPCGGTGLPFADSASSGCTIAAVFYQDANALAERSVVAHVSFGNGVIVLQTNDKGQVVISAGHTGPEAQPALRQRDIETAPVDARVPVLALVTWRTNGRISAHVLNARGETADGAENLAPPSRALHNIALGADGYWHYRDSGKARYPFQGGIAEFRVYANALAESDQKKLIEELRHEYFP